MYLPNVILEPSEKFDCVTSELVFTALQVHNNLDLKASYQIFTNGEQIKGFKLSSRQNNWSNLITIFQESLSCFQTHSIVMDINIITAIKYKKIKQDRESERGREKERERAL